MSVRFLVDLSCQAVTELVAGYMSVDALPVAERAQCELHLYACT